MTTPPIIDVVEASARPLAPCLVKDPVLDKSVANDVLPKLRTLSEADVRLIIREHALLLIVRFYHAVQSGEVQRDPATYFHRAVGYNPAIQRSIIARGSDLTGAEIDQLGLPAMINACAEVIHLAQCAHTTERLANIILEEAGGLVPELLAEPR
jgi:hypothetical protein